jgi:cellobiose phosphorylase
VSEVGALLLTPAYDRPVSEIGYITRYAAGLRENGGVYTHAATWAIAAFAKIGDAATVSRLLDAINPAKRDPERYWSEPYVLPGNVDGPESPYFGRGGWTWYTGSAAWLHRVVTQWVFGVRPEWDGLLVQPCLPPSWDGATMTRPYRGCTYKFRYERSAALPAGAPPEVTLNGERLTSNLIPSPAKAGAEYDVLVRYR